MGDGSLNGYRAAADWSECFTWNGPVRGDRASTAVRAGEAVTVLAADCRGVRV